MAATSHGSVTQIVCDTGYLLHGNLTAQAYCSETGYWEPTPTSCASRQITFSTLVITVNSNYSHIRFIYRYIQH